MHAKKVKVLIYIIYFLVIVVVHVVSSEPLHCMPVDEFETYGQLADHLQWHYHSLKSSNSDFRPPSLKYSNFHLESTNTKSMFMDYIDHAEGGKRLSALTEFRAGLHKVAEEGEPN